jgi:hypothetical protein
MKLTFRALILGICLTIDACAQGPGDARTASTTSAARLDTRP